MPYTLGLNNHGILTFPEYICWFLLSQESKEPTPGHKDISNVFVDLYRGPKSLQAQHQRHIESKKPTNQILFAK